MLAKHMKVILKMNRQTSGEEKKLCVCLSLFSHSHDGKCVERAFARFVFRMPWRLTAANQTNCLLTLATKLFSATS